MTEEARTKRIDELYARLIYIMTELRKRPQGHVVKKLKAEQDEIDRELSMLEANDPAFP
jgi:hypothetical protein